MSGVNQITSEEDLIEGSWYWIGADFPAKRRSASAGGWTNDDTWEDFTRSVSVADGDVWGPISAPQGQHPSWDDHPEDLLMEDAACRPIFDPTKPRDEQIDRLEIFRAMGVPEAPDPEASPYRRHERTIKSEWARMLRWLKGQAS